MALLKAIVIFESAQFFLLKLEYNFELAELET